MPEMIRKCGQCQTVYERQVNRCRKCDVTPQFFYRCRDCGNDYYFSGHASECEARHRDTSRTGIDWSDAKEVSYE